MFVIRSLDAPNGSSHEEHDDTMVTMVTTNLPCWMRRVPRLIVSTVNWAVGPFKSHEPVHLVESGV
jgi:hypothetical protein